MDERVTCSDGWASVDGDTFCCCIVAGPLIVSCPLAVGSKCWRLWADDVVSSPFSASLICCPEDSVDVDEDVDKVASPSTVELSPLGTKFILITAALGPSFLLASSCSSVFFRGFSAARIPLSTSCCSTVDPPFFSRCFPPFHPVSHRRKKETTTRQEKNRPLFLGLYEYIYRISFYLSSPAPSSFSQCLASFLRKPISTSKRHQSCLPVQQGGTLLRLIWPSSIPVLYALCHHVGRMSKTAIHTLTIKWRWQQSTHNVHLSVSTQQREPTN